MLMGIQVVIYKSDANLLRCESLKKIKLSLTDGDKNENGPLEQQIVAGAFALSQHGLCGFHLIDCSMASNQRRSIFGD
jgi:hypothetical protein